MKILEKNLNYGKFRGINRRLAVFLVVKNFKIQIKNIPLFTKNFLKGKKKNNYIC
jgi:hypothetical protein